MNFFTHSLLAIFSGEMFAHVSQLFSKYFCLFLFYPLSFGISGGFSDNLESFLVILGVRVQSSLSLCSECWVIAVYHFAGLR